MLQTKLMTAPTITQQQVNERFTEYAVSNKEHPELGFTMLMPAKWKMEATGDAPNAENPIVALARGLPAESSGGGSAFEILIWCSFLPREIHPADWLRARTKSLDYKLLDGRTLPSPHGMVADIICESKKENGAWLHRLTTTKDENRLFLIETRLQQSSHYDEEMASNVGLMAMSSFKLENPAKMRFSEPFAQLSMLGDSPVEFLVSELWEQKYSDDKPTGGSNLTLENKINDEAYGSIIVITDPQPGAGQSLEAITLEKLQLSGFEYSPASGDPIITQNDFFTYNISAFNGKSPGGGIEIVSAQIDVPTMSGLVLLTSPGEKDNFEAWAINRRAFDIIMESLTPKK